jgi:hypothetical protein
MGDGRLPTLTHRTPGTATPPRLFILSHACASAAAPSHSITAQGDAMTPMSAPAPDTLTCSRYPKLNNMCPLHFAIKPGLRVDCDQRSTGLFARSYQAACGRPRRRSRLPRPSRGTPRSNELTSSCDAPVALPTRDIAARWAFAPRSCISPRSVIAYDSNESAPHARPTSESKLVRQGLLPGRENAECARGLCISPFTGLLPTSFGRIGQSLLILLSVHHPGLTPATPTPTCLPVPFLPYDARTADRRDIFFPPGIKPSIGTCSTTPPLRRRPLPKSKIKALRVARHPSLTSLG